MLRSDIIRKVVRSDQAAIREKLQSPQMVQKTKAVRFPTSNIPKIFEVQSSALGQAVYTCYEYKVDATNWDATDGSDKFAASSSFDEWNSETEYEVGNYVWNGNATTRKVYKSIAANTNKEPPNAIYWLEVSVEILNLDENDPYTAAGYIPALCLYDRILAWLIVDDGGNNRWVGIPIAPPLRIVKARIIPSTEIIGSVAGRVTCDAWLRGAAAVDGELGYGMKIYGRAVPGVITWDDAVPILQVDGFYLVSCEQGHWYFNDHFMPSCINDANVGCL